MELRVMLAGKLILSCAIDRAQAERVLVSDAKTRLD
jgi:hypothetical protein